MPRINGKWTNFTSAVNQVVDDIYKKDAELRKKAAVHLRSEMKKKVNKTGRSLPGQPPGKYTGNLKKGIKYRKAKTIPHTHLVGTGYPANHAHLLELGTRKLKKRPFFLLTFREQQERVKEILSEERV